MGFAESLVWEALRQLAVAGPRLKMATMAVFNRLLAQFVRRWSVVNNRRPLFILGNLGQA